MQLNFIPFINTVEELDKLHESEKHFVIKTKSGNIIACKLQYESSHLGFKYYLTNDYELDISIDEIEMIAILDYRL